MKKYKALMLDLDGTTIPNKREGIPSQKVKEAITKASKKIHIGIATARPYFDADYLVKELRLSGPSIIHSGAQIIDTTTGEIYVEHRISSEDIQTIYTIAKTMDLPLLIDEDTRAVPATEKNIIQDLLGAVVMKISSEEIADAFCNALSHLSNISAHKIVSWTKGCFDVSIAHADATKQHGIYEVAKLLGIEPHEIIGVGDGYNDFPLLMACGLKIAMNNAVPELKAIADYVAPSVEKDGVADVIERFIL